MLFCTRPQIGTAEKQIFIEITTPEGTEENEIRLVKPNNSNQTLNKQKKLCYKKMKTDGTDREIIVQTKSLVMSLPPDKEIVKNKKQSPLERTPGCDKEQSGVLWKITVEAKRKSIRKT